MFGCRFCRSARLVAAAWRRDRERDHLGPPRPAPPDRRDRAAEWRGLGPACATQPWDLGPLQRPATMRRVAVNASRIALVFGIFVDIALGRSPGSAVCRPLS